MLDDRLTADERRALLYLVLSVALADGKLTETEVRFLQRLALPVGVEVGDLLSQIDAAKFDEHFGALRRPIAARTAVIELLRLAHVDDLYAHVEQSTIYSYSRRLGVADETLLKMEEWVEREWQHLAEGRRLVEVG